MKTLIVKSKTDNFNNEVIQLAENNGYTLSDIGTKNGDLLTLMIGDDGSRLVGFDLLGHDTIYNAYEIVNTDDTEIIEDWIKDHETSS